MSAEPIKDLNKIKDMLEALSMRKTGFRDALFFELGLSTALRVSDLIKIQKKDYKAPYLYVEIQKTKNSKKKDDKKKTIYLNEAVRTKLEAYIEHKKEDDVLFPFSRQMAHKMLKQSADMAGLDADLIATHTMRKTAAWRFYTESDCDIVKTQKFLGHRSSEDTVRYLGIGEEEVNNQLEVMSWS